MEDERRLYELRERQQQHEREWWKENLEGEEIRNEENRRFEHHKIAEIEDNTVQRNCR